MDLSDEWRVIRPDGEYCDGDGVVRSIDMMWVREVVDSVELWALVRVSGGESFEVRFAEQRVDVSVVDLLKNLGSVSVSFRDGVTVTFDGELGLEFDMNGSMLVGEFGSVEAAEASVERQLD